MTFNEEQDKFDKKPVIKVFGVGGCGNKTINRMINYDVRGVVYYAVNTDVQDLRMSNADRRIQIGCKLTRGLGAGTKPEVGYNAALESENALREEIEGADMVYIIAGMGGGTGTGAAPVVARLAKELGILTIGVCTKPFNHEGPECRENARQGLLEMRRYVDTLIVIPNQKLIDMSDPNTPYLACLREADDVLRQAVQGLAEIINLPQTENIDLADVYTVMRDKGTALMGIGVAKGPNRAIEAARKAISSRLLEVTIEGATDCIINISADENLGMLEVDNIVSEVRNCCDRNLNVIRGITISKDLGDELVVTIVATGYELKAKEQGIDDLKDRIYGDTSSERIEFNIENTPIENLLPTSNDEEEDIEETIVEPKKKPGFFGIFGKGKDKSEEKTEKKHHLPEGFD